MTRAADENEILDSLGRIISTHADWLDGRTFQRLCQQVAARTSKSRIWIV
ncbi:hypothetical protein ACOAOY_11870 [Pseudomonas aeruginosa]|nr:hypothetical protein [Pseudomonas aeruginosa]